MRGQLSSFQFVNWTVTTFECTSFLYDITSLTLLPICPPLPKTSKKYAFVIKRNIVGNQNVSNRATPPLQSELLNELV